MDDMAHVQISFPFQCWLWPFEETWNFNRLLQLISTMALGRWLQQWSAQTMFCAMQWTTWSTFFFAYNGAAFTISSTVLDSFFTVRMMAHGLLRFVAMLGWVYTYVFADRGNFSNNSGKLWMVLSFTGEPLELLRWQFQTRLCKK